MYIYQLNKQDLDLSKAEVHALAKKSGKMVDEYLFLDELVDYKRLAYTKKVCKLLFSSTKKDLAKDLASFNFNKMYKTNFRLSLVHNKDFTAIDLADIIWKKLKNPKSAMKNPVTNIEIIFSKKVYCCLVVWENKEPFEERRAHLRPKNHPTSLHPRLARSMVNLANSKEILDPFCGSGGILLEAGLIGLKITGYDLDDKMIQRAEENLEHYKVDNYELIRFSALKLADRFEAIVTDMPYGKNSKVEDIHDLHEKFLIDSYNYAKTMVVAISDKIPKKIVTKTKWKIISEFTYYLHKSLSKKIYVLKKT